MLSHQDFRSISNILLIVCICNIKKKLNKDDQIVSYNGRNSSVGEFF